MPAKFVEKVLDKIDGIDGITELKLFGNNFETFQKCLNDFHLNIFLRRLAHWYRLLCYNSINILLALVSPNDLKSLWHLMSRLA